MVRVQGGEGNLQALAAIQMALIWSWGRGELEGSPCRGSGCENSGLQEVAASNRRTVGLSDRGWDYKGAGTPFCSWSSGEWLVRIQTS